MWGGAGQQGLTKNPIDRICIGSQRRKEGVEMEEAAGKASEK